MNVVYLFKMSDIRMTFHIADYVILVLFLIISSGIGLYYGVFHRQVTTEEYLVGGRNMHLVPVAMSLLVTYQSAISVLGVPLEHYMYDMMSNYMWIAIMIASAVQGLVIVPLLYPLKLTSAYEVCNTLKS